METVNVLRESIYRERIHKKKKKKMLISIECCYVSVGALVTWICWKRSRNR